MTAPQAGPAPAGPYHLRCREPGCGFSTPQVLELLRHHERQHERAQPWPPLRRKRKRGRRQR